jgi:transposase
MNEYNTTIGIDLGDKYSAICVLDAQEDVVEESKLRTTQADFTNRFE